MTGVISGLFDGSTGAASSVFVTSNTGLFGVGEYVGNPRNNSFTVQNGAIVGAFFRSFGEDNDPPAVTCCTLQLAPISRTVFLGALSPEPNRSGWFPTAGQVTFTQRAASPVPVPATLALLGVGLLGLCVSRRKRKLQN